MATYASENQELLRLLQFVFKIGDTVLTELASDKMLSKYNNNFQWFLTKEKHEIVHLFQPKRICCACSPAVSNLKRKSINLKGIKLFEQLYKDNDPEDRRHIICVKGEYGPGCIHKYTSRNTSVDELEMSVLSFLLKNFAHLSSNEKNALDRITFYKNKFCNLYSSNCSTIVSLETAWNELEDALLNIRPLSSTLVVQHEINNCRTRDVTKEDKRVLLGKIKTNIVSIFKVLCMLDTPHNGSNKLPIMLYIFLSTITLF